MTIRWTITVELGEYDNRRNQLTQAIADLRGYLINEKVRHGFAEEHDGEPAVKTWGNDAGT